MSWRSDVSYGRNAFCTDNNIIMHRKLIIRHCVFFLEQEVQFHPSLSLKLGCGSRIYKFNQIWWNSACKRWQRTAETVIPWPDCQTIDLELYHQDDQQPVVVAEGAIPVPTGQASMRKEIRISLLLDGLYMGCLFCVLDDGPEEQMVGNFLYLHKIDILLLEKLDHAFQLQILNNQQIIYEKSFHLHLKGKNLFPNLKMNVKMSDVITIAIRHCAIIIREVRFVVDSVKRGKTSIYESWLRNPIKNKVGDIKIQYFIENIYLDNQRQVFSRNAIFPKKMQELIPPPMTEQEKDLLRRSVIIRQLEEADRRIIKLNSSVHQFVNRMQKQSKENRRTAELPQRQYRGTLTKLKE